jgi:hypothetical protein
MMDVSGSMGEEQKELVRLESFWIDTWLRKNYEGIESRYIVHDVSAKEVDKHTFYHLREDGGTKISSAFRCCQGAAGRALQPGGMEHLSVPFQRRRQQLRSRQPRLREAAQGAACCRSATCSAIARWPAPMARGISSTCCTSTCAGNPEGADEPGEFEG